MRLPMSALKVLSSRAGRTLSAASHGGKQSVGTVWKYGPLNLARGLFVRRQFAVKQFIVVLGGWPFPSVKAKGRIDASVCILSPGVRIEVARGARLSLGKGVYLNRGVRIICHERIEIGAGTRIAYDAIIADTDEHETRRGGPMSATVKLGEGCWIGSRAIVLKGVNIGEGAIIGAGAVVTRDIPPHAVAVGQPARVVRIEGPSECTGEQH